MTRICIRKTRKIGIPKIAQFTFKPKFALCYLWKKCCNVLRNKRAYHRQYFWSGGLTFLIPGTQEAGKKKYIIVVAFAMRISNNFYIYRLESAKITFAMLSFHEKSYFVFWIGRAYWSKDIVTVTNYNNSTNKSARST